MIIHISFVPNINVKNTEPRNVTFFTPFPEIMWHVLINKQSVRTEGAYAVFQ